MSNKAVSKFTKAELKEIARAMVKLEEQEKKDREAREGLKRTKNFKAELKTFEPFMINDGSFHLRTKGVAEGYIARMGEFVNEGETLVLMNLAKEIQESIDKLNELTRIALDKMSLEDLNTFRYSNQL